MFGASEDDALGVEGFALLFEDQTAHPHHVVVGEGELVMFCQGSSARQAEGLKPLPVDAAVVSIVDTVNVLGKKIYNCN